MPASGSTMKLRSAPFLTVGLVVCALAGLAAFFSISLGGTITLPQFGKVPEFVLSDTNEKPFSSSTLLGKVWIVNFFFASCPAVCPAVNGRLASLNRIYKDNGELRLVSITIDPSNDTSQALAEYSKRFGAVPGKWDFLTGPAALINALRAHQFKIDSGDSIEFHSTRVVLIDRTGTVRGFYQGNDDQGVNQLTRDIQIVLAETGRA